MTTVKLELAKTFFPEFTSDSEAKEGVPDAAEISDSDDDSIKREKYRTKEDQDVAVFMALAKQMSIKSLLHLLQGHARTQNLPDKYLYAAAYEVSTPSSPKRSKPVRKIKKFRFAEITEHKVRTVVHEVFSYKEEKSLWWNQEEMQEIRSDVIQTVRYFRKHRPEYAESVEIVADSHRGINDQSVVEDHLKKLMEDSYARGLETHIVRRLSSLRKDTVHAVLQEQSECRLCNDSYDISSQCLREQSLAYSVTSVTFASKMGACDHIDALKASLSAWKEPERIAI